MVHALREAEGTHKEVIERIRSQHRISNGVRARMLDGIGEFDELKMAGELGERSTAAWLIRDLKLAYSTAYEYVHVGRGVRRFRHMYVAFEEGALDYTTVRLLLRYLTEENEMELVMLARRLCRAELEQALAGLEDGEGAAKKEPEEPHLKVRRLDDGSLEIRAHLKPVEGEAFLAALKLANLANYGLENVDLEDPDAVDTALERAAAEDNAVETEQVKEADRHTQTMTENILGDASRFGPPQERELYPAFLAMINMVRTAPVSPLRAPGAQVSIMLNVDGRAWSPGNVQASSDVLHSYVANAVIRLHLLDEDGLTLHYGRARRFASDGQVGALMDMWGHQCAMPGCAHSRFLEIHHIREWADGGETNIANLIPLCSSCHSRVSNNLVEINEWGGTVEFTMHDGSRYLARKRDVPVVV